MFEKVGLRLMPALEELFGEFVELPGGGHGDVLLENAPGDKAFCPTGEGGGIDNSCPPNGGGGPRGWSGGGPTYTKPITNAKEASKIVAQAVADWYAYRESRGWPIPDSWGTETTADDVQKNWERAFRARSRYVGDKAAFSDLDKEEIQRIGTAMQQNKENAEFQKFVQKHGDTPVVYMRSEKGSNAGAEWRSNIFVYPDEFRGRLLEKFEPGMFHVSGGATDAVDSLAAMLRHEYGHKLHDTLTPEQVQEWKSALPEVDVMKKGFTGYAASNENEAFAEIFAASTDAKFKAEDFPEFVSDLIKLQRSML